MPDIGDLVTARIVGEISGQPIINNLSFVLVAPFATWKECTDQLFFDLDGALTITSPSGDFMSARSSQYVLNSFQVIDVSPGVAPMQAYALDSAGALADECLPPNDSLAITLRSDFKGPSGRGRVYLAGYPESAQQNGFWVADAQTNAGAIATDLDTAFGELAGSAAFRWAVLHKVSAGAPIVPPEVKPVMSWTVHNEVRSIGRRAIGRRIRRTRPAA